nr:ribosomal protein S8 [Apopellia endiviifolia]WIA66300.1 ribosomal protein S8 [Apopellia endiviifolia]WIA66341.1 ribosomal protein S8 [Apopellia endiviifolia]WIA66382.1 ribosomal protein S8 [Apopellia endiviifolia]WKW95103.1 ribosomal protein S8 [Apopellia endiviifolia]
MNTLSNLLSSIKNAQKAQKRVPHFSSLKISERKKRKIIMPRVFFVSRLCWDFCRILYNEGYIHGFSQEDGSLRIVLKYHFSGIGVIKKMETISKPGFRIYSKNRLSKREHSQKGLGITILSTSLKKGKRNLICDREAQSGEILCQVF